MTNEELATRIQQGERELIPELWEQVHDLIYWHVNRFCTQYSERCTASGVTEDDLKQTSFLALLDAVKGYKPDGEYKFTTYLNYPLINHFKAALGIRTAKRNPLDRCASLDMPIGEDGSGTLADMVPGSGTDMEDCERAMYLQQLHTVMRESLDTLPDDLQDVIRSRYFAGEHRQVIGERMGLSREQVRQMEMRGLQKLRQPKITRKLRPFLYVEITEQEAYRGSGFKTFSYTHTSSVERAYERIERYRTEHGMSD